MGISALAPGSLFANRFEIHGVAGLGGMGTVYRATDRSSNETVALKLLHTDGAGGLHPQERFSREARFLSELRHPGIVGHVAHGQTLDGQRFLAMEWLEGQDLCQRLANGPLPVCDCLRLLAQVADALAVAHSRGIVHRDLKPSNLLLVGGDVGQVKILDFGIARRVLMDPADAITQTGAVVGTPRYMAPEQARGDVDLTPAADLFSIGCILYECLTGRPPFAGENLAAVLVRILFDDPIPVEQLRPGVPAVVSALVGRLLARQKEQRLADAAALRAELQRIGDVSEPDVAVVTPNPIAEIFAEKTQSLFSIVLAAPPGEQIGSGMTQPGSEVQLASGDRQMLIQALVSLGGAVDYLANGMLVVTVPSLGSAQDQATVAARAALLIKERWPDASVSMSTGRGTSRGRTAVGEVIDSAARLLTRRSQPSAKEAPSGVLIDPLSASLLEGRFAKTPQPVGALLLYEEREVDASRPLLGRPTPFVGREAELGLLEGHLQACIEESEARVVLVSAPPGVGKSRLRHEFLRRVEKRNERLTVLSGRGELMNAGAPHSLLGQAVRKLCGISGSEPLDAQRDQLKARVAAHVAACDRHRVVAFLGELSRVPFPAQWSEMLPPARDDPRIMRERINRAFLDWLGTECKAAPVLLVLDDLQWGDALSIALINDALRSPSNAPLFVLAMTRPEVKDQFPNLWQGHQLQEITLKGLSKRACERLVKQVLGTQISRELAARLLSQSEGNALYLEELIRAAAEGKLDEQPATVVAMLQARISRLDVGPRRALLAASLFGQIFWEGGVAAVLGLSKGAVERTQLLEVLHRAELILPSRQSRFANETEFHFRHALIQEAVYGLLTNEDRKLGHRLAGQYLEEAGERDAMILAEHAERAGQAARAVTLYVRAAEQSMERHELHGVRIRVERGICAGAADEELATLRVLLFGAGLLGGDFTAPVAPVFSALDLLAPGSRWWCQSMPWLLLSCAHQGEHEKLSILAQRLCTVEPRPDARAAYVSATSWLVAMFSYLGLRDPARSFLDLTQKVALHLSASDANVRGLAEHGHAWYLRNLEPEPYQAMLVARNAVRAFEVAGNIVDQTAARLCQAMAFSELGDSGAGERLLRETLGLPICEAEATAKGNVQVYLAQLLVRREEQHDLDEACALAQKVIEANMSPVYTGLAKTVFAHAALLRGQVEKAVEEAHQAVAFTKPMPPYQLDAQAILIQALLQQGRTALACALAEEVCNTLERLSGIGYGEVPVRLAIAEAWHAHGEVSRARQALQEAYRQLQKRTESIPDPEWRNKFTTRVPANARVLSLVRAEEPEIRKISMV